ncbi:tetratricopeptide repeat protein [Rhodocytophaga rosea]|uniref:Tetratricopeptide repeat protein n=1 Tax=Rhodocytophaga rosea TaxID=2704465 RepID=A0A6C0GM69_9BACT|nr:tetratricopeptide repeat protein [Rhodocytophaga rosea]QHT69037.1 tetratricopeptide repeat protein [Rhodocytophaga rosea]
MLENISLAELIDNYLSGRLNQEEKSAFEQRLSAETALAEQVALQRKITTGLQTAGRLNMLALLKEEDAKMPAYQPEEEATTATEAKTISFNPTSKQMYYWAAAAVLLLMVPVFMLLRANESGEKLADSYFHAHENQWVSTDGDSSLSAQAMEHYEEGKYAMALNIFEKMLGNNTAEAEVQFYKGNSYLALKKTQEAIQSFEAVLTMPANKYTEEAEWYLALSYVQADDEKQAKKILKGIMDNENHPYHKEAQDLMKKL